MAYYQAIRQFLDWCQRAGFSNLEDIEPIHVAAYIEQHPGSAAAIKQDMAAIRMMFSWLAEKGILAISAFVKANLFRIGTASDCLLFHFETLTLLPSTPRKNPFLCWTESKQKEDWLAVLTASRVWQRSLNTQWAHRPAWHAFLLSRRKGGDRS
jgi:Phage integrase, N-terminal SAM-like domain